MQATIFIVNYNFTEADETAEGCLRKLESRLLKVIGKIYTLTFRPMDGMIFCENLSTTIPIGVLYAQGYPAPIHEEV